MKFLFRRLSLLALTLLAVAALTACGSGSTGNNKKGKSEPEMVTFNLEVDGGERADEELTIPLAGFSFGTSRDEAKGDYSSWVSLGSFSFASVTVADDKSTFTVELEVDKDALESTLEDKPNLYLCIHLGTVNGNSGSSNFATNTHFCTTSTVQDTNGGELELVFYN